MGYWDSSLVIGTIGMEARILQRTSMRERTEGLRLTILIRPFISFDFLSLCGKLAVLLVYLPSCLEVTFSVFESSCLLLLPV